MVVQGDQGIKITGQQRFKQTWHGVFAQPYRQRRHAAGQPSKNRRNQTDGKKARCAKAQNRRLAAFATGGFRFRLYVNQLTKQQPGSVHRHRFLRGLLQAARSLVKNFKTQHALDLFQGLAKRRLGQAQRLRGSTQTSGGFDLGNELEVTEPKTC